MAMKVTMAKKTVFFSICIFGFNLILLFICISLPVKCMFVLWLCLQVAMATAAKAKLLVRELKTVKADLTFAKQRCSQLEDENRILREAREKGGNPADDDMVISYICVCL